MRSLKNSKFKQTTDTYAAESTYCDYVCPRPGTNDRQQSAVDNYLFVGTYIIRVSWASNLSTAREQYWFE